jgi:hypothetical protein
VRVSVCVCFVGFQRVLLPLLLCCSAQLLRPVAPPSCIWSAVLHLVRRVALAQLHLVHCCGRPVAVAHAVLTQLQLLRPVAFEMNAQQNQDPPAPSLTETVASGHPSPKYGDLKTLNACPALTMMDTEFQ